MIAESLTVMLVLALTVSALAGPWVLRRAAPALVRAPRTSAALLTGSVVSWVITALALGPLLAWITSGPVLLPGSAADVCQRCLAAANPFPTATIDTGIPAAVLLALSALGAAGLAIMVGAEAHRQRRATTRTAHRLRVWAEPRQVLGHSVLVIDDARPFALTLPRRHGGIFISKGTLRALTRDELAAVLAHEHAHLYQRHHLITTTVASICRPLRWLPMMVAVEDALGHYLEIAADDAARRRVGTPALASALLTLGEHAHHAGHEAPLDGALHALGPDRIRHLVQPHTGPAGLLAALTTTSYLATLVLLATTVYLPYLGAALSGCA
ncbi:M56 family metallopeptidase [Citricoccus nitrophenolicus]